MSDSRKPRDVLAGLQDWKDAHLTQLDGGLTNRSWLVEADGRKAVLKIDDQPRVEPYNSRAAEAQIQARAAGRGLAPGVLHHDERVLLTEYVEGVVWEPDCLKRDDNIELVASALRRLHALPLTGRSFDSLVAARRYVASIKNADAALATHCTQVIGSMRQPHNLCCCHNDLVAANILTVPEMMFLDWEYACDNDPFFDLATIVEHHELDDDTASRLLDAYFDGDGERWRPKLLEQQTLYLALYWLWLASRSESTQDELAAVAERIGA